MCEGKCSKRFHAACVGLDKEQWNALSNNVIWLCDCCMADFCKYRDRRDPLQSTNETRSVDVEIAELKTKIDVILSTLVSIAVPKPPSSVENAQCHSTPVSSSNTRGGTNSLCDYRFADVCENDEQHSQNDVNNTFDLYLTNISPNVTELEISAMVSRCLGINSNDNLNVKKLVSKGKDCSKLDYVSFKVTLNEHYKLLAMSSNTWPERVKYREFVNRHNDTWKP